MNTHEQLVEHWMDILPQRPFDGYSFQDLRPFWMALSKIEVTDGFDSLFDGPIDQVRDSTKCLAASFIFGYQMAFKTTTQKCDYGRLNLTREFDGRFDFRVRNATFARLVAPNVSIDFVTKDDFLELEGCTIDSPWYPSQFGATFSIETDGEEVEFKGFMIEFRLRKLICEMSLKFPFSSYFFGSKMILSRSMSDKCYLIENDEY
jgi:hypothetical protein